jgi:hypothetical protein
MSKTTAAAARAAIRDAGKDENDIPGSGLPKEVVMEYAKMFAAQLLAQDEMANPQQRSGTEADAQDIVRNGTPLEQAQKDIPDLDADTFERFGALKSLAEESNENASHDGEERFPDAGNASDILERIAQAIIERRQSR